MSDIRNQRLAAVIHRATQSVLAKGLADPRLAECMVTVTDVKLSPDQSTAVLSVSITPERRERLALSALEAASRHIRRKSADLVSVHRMPELIFKLDRSFKRQSDVLAALNLVREELGVRPGEPLPSPHADAAGGGSVDQPEIEADADGADGADGAEADDHPANDLDTVDLDSDDPADNDQELEGDHDTR